MTPGVKAVHPFAIYHNCNKSIVYKNCLIVSTDCTRIISGFVSMDTVRNSRCVGITDSDIKSEVNTEPPHASDAMAFLQFYSSCISVSFNMYASL